jgi:hypothetical protein
VEYKGYDYTELYPALGIGTDDTSTNMQQARAKMSDLFANSMMDREGGKEALSAFAIELRRYLTVLAEVDPGFAGPLWKGLVAIEDDESLIQYFLPLMTKAWS